MTKKVFLMRFFLGMFLFLSFQSIWSQAYAGLAIDNDLFFGKDYYYSSGVFLQYGYTKDPKAKPLTGVNLFSPIVPEKKKSVHWTLGQQIFTPIGRYDSVTKNMDYPFSGYLFLERSVFTHKKETQFWGWGVQIGLSGPPSLSKPLQNIYHKTVLRLPALSWVGAQAAGVHLAIKGQHTQAKTLAKKLHFSHQIQAQFGSHITEGSLRTGIQWGLLDPLAFYGPPNTSAQSGWSTHLGIQLKYNLQDYNLSGSLFNDASTFTLPSNAFRNTIEAGIAYRNQNWQFLAMAKARSKDTPRQKYPRHEVMYLSVLKLF